MMRLAAEWEKQMGTLLGFPYNPDDFPGKLKEVQEDFINYIKEVSLKQKVFLLVPNETEKLRLRLLLGDAGVELEQLEFVLHEMDRNWLRDCGPILVEKEKQTLALNFEFNAWAKYPNYHKDNRVPEILAKKLGIEFLSPTHKGQNIVLEGGAIDTNGNGTIMSTEECLLDPEMQIRNPGFTQTDYESIFKAYFGCPQTIWLNKGIAGDDTHGHIDDLCRFITDDTVILAEEKDTTDVNYTILEENNERLQGIRLENGKSLKVIRLPMPSPIYFDDDILPASYANFLFINGALLMPTFNQEGDEVALGILREVYGKEVRGVPAQNLILGLGTLHCLSMQLPQLLR